MDAPSTGPAAGLALPSTLDNWALPGTADPSFRALPTAAVPADALPHDLSPLGMYRQADIVVKAVMIGLAFASVVTWTVLVVKALELWGASASAQGGIRRIQRAGTLEAAVAASGSRRDAVSRMIRQAADEYRRSQPALDAAGDGGVKERVQSQLERIEAVAGRRMGRGTGVLATIGSTAPFVGLFGGLAQFIAGLYGFKARDTLVTVINTMWGSFWISIGILYAFVVSFAFLSKI